MSPTSPASPSREGQPLRWLLFAAVALLLVVAAVWVPSLRAQDAPPDWAAVDTLVSEQKYQAAADAVDTILAAAREAGDAEAWTTALVRGTQLRLGLHGYERAWRYLIETPWPEEEEHRLVLRLFAAETLVAYLRAYRWDVEQRERIAAGADRAIDGALDVETATAGELTAAAHDLLAEVWTRREGWGDRGLGDLGQYVAEGTYPARVRGTLRDVVTYHWVDLLSDSSLWTPAASNAVARLDLERLAAADASALAAPADEPAHPLERAMALLADLEAWHGTAGRSEAALEARLERFRRLAQHAQSDDDVATLRRLLTAHLDTVPRTLPWWAMGQVELAELVRRDDDPDALVRAHALARAAAETTQDSFGRRRARQLVAEIERPHYQLSAMESDGAGRRSLLVEHQNLERLHLRAYRLTVDELLEGTFENVVPQWRDVPVVTESRAPAAEWTVDLPPTPDFRSHRTYVTPPLPELGYYLVVASARADFAPRGNALLAVPFQRTGMVATVRHQADEVAVTMLDGAAGGALAGVTVELWRRDWGQRQPRRLERTATTGDDGVARFAGLAAPARHNPPLFLVARRGDDALIDGDGIYPQVLEPGQPERSTLLYSDRSVYRPGQDVAWKAVAFVREGGAGDDAPVRFRVLPGSELTVTLVDANGETVATETVTSNDFGSASGRFAIPRGRLLGGWHLTTSLGGFLPVQVEEYVRPTFEVELADPAAEMRLGEPATFRGTARYYFGSPLPGGEVTWQVYREPVWPWWWRGWSRPAGGARELVAAGATEVDADGGFAVTFTPEADRTADPAVSYRYRLAVAVTAEGGETRDAERVFRLGNVAVEARLVDPPGFHLAGEPVTLDLLRSDLDGVGRAGAGRWQLLPLEQPAEARLPAEQPVVPEEAPGLPVDVATGEDGDADDEAGYRTAGDLLRPRWAQPLPIRQAMALWPAGPTVASGTVEHGAEGAARLDLGAVEAGVYRLRYTTEDAWGAVFTMEHDLVVAADGMRLELPAVLLAERSAAAPGETVRLLVHSGLPDQEMRFRRETGDAETGDALAPARVLRAGDGARIFEVAVEPADQGGMRWGLELVRDYQWMVLREEVRVPWTTAELDVDLASFRDELRPGADETWTVTVRGDDGAAVAAGAAEVLAYMFDRSLEVFAPHRPPVVVELYPQLGWTAQPQASVGQATPVWSEGRGFGRIPDYEPPVPPHLVLLSGYGIGGPGARRLKSLGYVGGEVAEEMRVTSEVAAMPAPAAPQAMDAVGEGDLREQAQDAAAAAPPAADVELRTDFAETAFFLPHLETGDDGSVSFTFTVPEAVTEWSVWVHALTRDLRGGSAEERVRTTKELLVRPYLPRFFREGDRVELAVVVNNTGEETLSGRLDLALLDPDDESDLGAAFGLAPERAAAEFAVAPGSETELVFPVTVPARVGEVAVRAVGRAETAAGALSDGELRVLPVLPGRMHLTQSRFAALHEGDARRLVFGDLARGDDPSRVDEALVVTVDAQLFATVLQALPYLVDYPYECSEQTLNRFLAAGILATVYDRHPEVAAMAEGFSGRATRYEAWDDDDPNRQMALVETPWLALARGGGDADGRLVDLLAPEVATRQRDAALATLVETQTANGAFPWFPGGPPSPYMTVYVLYGFAKAQELGVPIADDPAAVAAIRRAWDYLHGHYVDELLDRMVDDDCCWELVTFLGYVLSAYPDSGEWTGGVFTADDRRRMLEHSFRHWREHSPLLKAYLALTLHRAGREADARLVFDSLMDSAKTDPDLGTYWAPEDRAWLWYNDTTEGHALALRALSELAPDDPRRRGLMQWLMLDKKLNHWKSTRATAEVVYALVHYLEAEGAVAARETVTVDAGPRHEIFVFEPDRYVGQSQVVIPGEAVEPAMAEIAVAKEGPGLAFASATWHFSTERLPAAARGDLFAVERRYFHRRQEGDEWVLEPLASGARLAAGDQLEVALTVRADHAAEYVHLRDPRPAGFEPEDLRSGYRWDLGLSYYQETRDSGTNFFFDWLPAGEYVLRYRLRAAHGGTFKSAPAELQSMYAPEFNAYSAGAVLAVGEESAP